VLNIGPCLAIGRLEMVATELAQEMGVDIPQLPLVLSAAQWLEEQALADGAFGLALGLPLHLGLSPFIDGSDVAVTTLTETMRELTGGHVIINGDAKATAEILDGIVQERRSALGI
jgi:carbon-monoxide dehydrogenase catalytic subunit